jgi:hypothetical protein
MSQLPIGNIGQPFREQDLRDLLHALAEKQGITEQLVISTRTGVWHAGISKLRRVTSQKTRELIRGMAHFVAEGLHRDTTAGLGFDVHEDSGSILVEDLRLYGPKRLSERWDVVVSWGASRKDLDREIDSVRACLDALGIFDDTELRVQDLHGRAKTWVGDVMVQEDRVHHERTVSGKLNISRIAAAMGHVIPGLSKLEIGGKVKTRIPYEDSREKFIAALMALQWQSNGTLPECTELSSLRDRAPAASLEILQALQTKMTEANAFLKRSMEALDHRMQEALLADPRAGFTALDYQACQEGLERGEYEYAIRSMEAVQRTAPRVREAMGENYYLFAANVIMQAQIAWFEQDLFGVCSECARRMAAWDAGDRSGRRGGNGPEYGRRP